MGTSLSRGEEFETGYRQRTHFSRNCRSLGKRSRQVSKAMRMESFFALRPILIRPNPDQPRRHMDPDKLNELADTIKQKGLLQPLVVQIDENGDYTLIAGERRLLACKMAGVKRVPVMVKTGDRAELALIENIQREDLNPVDEAEALNDLMLNHQYTQEELASKIGKARSTIAETLIK